jgi:hypothetical protein
MKLRNYQLACLFNKDDISYIDNNIEDLKKLINKSLKLLKKQGVNIYHNNNTLKESDKMKNSVPIPFEDQNKLINTLNINAANFVFSYSFKEEVKNINKDL